MYLVFFTLTKSVDCQSADIIAFPQQLTDELVRNG